MMKMANLGQKHLKEKTENHVQKDKKIMFDQVGKECFKCSGVRPYRVEG